MIIALKHPDHGVHVAYTETEAQVCELSGWKRDPELSKELANGRVPAPSPDEPDAFDVGETFRRGPGRPRKDAQ